jgi:hypothetical protein
MHSDMGGRASTVPLGSPWHIGIAVDSPVELSDNRSNGFPKFSAVVWKTLGSGLLWISRRLAEVNLPSPKGPPLTQSLAVEVYVSQWLVAYGSFSAW